MRDLEMGSYYFAEHILTELHLNKIRVHFTKIKDKFKSHRNEDVSIFYTKRARIVFKLTTTTLSLTVWHSSAVEEAKDILQTLLTIYEEKV
jgi:hypothetical protein